MKYIYYYISDIIPFLIPVALIILVIRFIMYKKGGKKTVLKEAAVLFFWIYITAMLLKTVVPEEWLHFNFASSAIMMPNKNYIYNNPVQSLIYIRAFVLEKLWFRLFHVFILNLIMLFPFGLLFPYIFPKYRKLTVLIGLCISIGIEALQLFTPRLSDTFDIFLNFLGVAAGYSIYILITKLKERRDVK